MGVRGCNEAMDDPARHTHAYRGTRPFVIGAAAVSIGVHAMLFGLAVKVSQSVGTPKVIVGRAQAAAVAKPVANVPERPSKKSVKRADRPDSVRPTSLSIHRA